MTVNGSKTAREECEHLLLHLLLLKELLLKELLHRGLLLLPHLLKHDNLGLLHACLLCLKPVLPLIGMTLLL
jgi:hypothetical protein